MSNSTHTGHPAPRTLEAAQRDLIAAAERGNTEQVHAALSHGADANTVAQESGQPVLTIAASRGHVGVVELLLSAGADPNRLDRRAGASALHKAAQAAHVPVTKALVEAGAFIDLQAPRTGHTPLIEAVWFKAVGVVEYLLRHGARLELNTAYGFSLDDHIQYMIKVSHGTKDHASIQRIQELVAERRERDRCAAAREILAATLAGDTERVKAAIAAGADLEARYPMASSFSDHHTPLLLAARDGHEEIARALIAAGADVNAVEPTFGAVPLHKATYNGYAEITRMLANAPGIQLDYQGPSNGYTPLHDALWHGFGDCAAILLDAGAAMHIAGYDGKLPGQLALENLGADHPVTQRLRR